MDYKPGVLMSNVKPKIAIVHDYLNQRDEADYVKIIIFGGKDEIELVDVILENMKESPINVVGKTSLRQTAALIEKCKIFISNDTGPMHIAAAMGVPVVAIFGPTNFYRTSPFGKQHIIVKSDLPCVPCYRGGNAKCDEIRCLKLISVDDVLNAVESLITKL